MHRRMPPTEPSSASTRLRGQDQVRDAHHMRRSEHSELRAHGAQIQDAFRVSAQRPSRVEMRNAA
jgi:hypothetical protein